MFFLLSDSMCIFYVTTKQMPMAKRMKLDEIHWLLKRQCRTEINFTLMRKKNYNLNMCF